MPNTPDRKLTVALGALTGGVGLIAMIRLVSGAFSGGMTGFAWIATLVAMVPWIGYVAWRAAHGRMSARRGCELAERVGLLCPRSFDPCQAGGST